MIGDHLILVVVKFSGLAVVAGAALWNGVLAAVDGSAVGAAVGVGSFASITAIAMWRLLKDNRLLTDLERQRNYEREQKEQLAAQLTESDLELGHYRRTYGTLDE